MNPTITQFVRLMLIVLSILPITTSAQKKDPPPQSLLWRITGNGLAEPSYLYGTIHLTDKRVFNFGDSLYAAIERSNGYAMELNPDSLMIEYFKEEKEDPVLLKDVISSSDFNRIKKKLQERFGKSPNKITVKEFKESFNDWLTQLNENGSMQTIMDAYFYNVARRQGKWVGGIEDVTDQLPHRDDNTSVDEYYIQDFMDDNKASKRYLEEMISAYTKEDITQIEKMSASGEESGIDEIMLRRNRKMARRMDSLSHIRSMFFAVGSAHLPGDSGVISFLRNRGFKVEPVVSSKRIHASEYKFPVKHIPWTTITSGTGLYTIDMPGEPQKEGANYDYDNLDMKMYADISTNLFYISMGVTGKEWKNEDSLMRTMVRNMNRRASITSSKNISSNGVSGKEFIASAEKITYRIQLFFNSPNIYFTLVGSPLKDGVYSDDANRFFKSLTINKNAVAKSTNWQQYTNTQYGFSVAFPGKPMEKVQNTESDESIKTTVYSALDVQHGVYYQFMVQDLRKGYYLTSDTSLFGNYRDNIAANEACTLFRCEFVTEKNYPAMWIEFSMKNENETFYNKVLNLHRGNRIYYLFVTAEDPGKSKTAIDSFFHSFSFIPLKEKEWSQQWPPDKSFSTWAPAPVEKYVDSTEDKDETIYDMYDETAPVTFYVRKTPYPEFFWADSDTSLLRREADASITSNDSLLEYKLVTNGNYKGVELLVQLPDNHNLKKMRLLLVGDTLYNIYGVTSKDYLLKNNVQRFFSDFRVNRAETPTTLFQYKAKQLMDALQSEDSATFAKASATLSSVKFTAKELPLLHERLIQWYPDTAVYGIIGRQYIGGRTNFSLFNIVASLKDKSTIGFVRKAYAQLPADKEEMRYELLYMLASFKTSETYTLLKELLLSRPPAKGNAFQLYSEFNDSLSLAADIFPALLPLMKDSANKWHIASLTEDLLDSNLVQLSTLAPYKKDFYELANEALKKLNKDENADQWYWNYELINTLGKFGQPEDFQVIRKYLLQKNSYLRYSAVVALLKHAQPVDAAELLKLASENAHRIDLYNFLTNDLKKPFLFPKKYLTQQAFAESEIYSYGNEDNDVKKITFLGERTALYKGSMKKFYLFKVDMSYEDEKVIHLGIAGPYAVKSSKPETEGEAGGIYWGKEFDAKTVEADFKEYLQKLEEE